MATSNDRTAELACVVIGLGNPASLVDAVRSLVEQDMPSEIIVVNTGGGDPVASLAAAGLQVAKTITRDERLFAGGARNLGIENSTAPYIAFLAADCTALPGWASGRVEKHRAGAQAVSSSICNPYPRNLAAVAEQVLLFAARFPRASPAKWKHYGCSYDRTLITHFGMFRDDLRTAEDTEFHARLSQGGVEFTAGPDVRTGHRHQTTLPGLLKSHYCRGRHRAKAAMEVPGAGLLRPSGNLRRIPRLLKMAWTASSSEEKWLLALAFPLIVMGSIAAFCGAWIEMRQSKTGAAA